MSLADLFEWLAGWTWDMLETAHVQRVRFGEDAVTSMLAVAINRFGPAGVRVVDVRRDEPRDGADVEIWFVREDGRACGFSVQAKRVSEGPKVGGSYAELDHPRGGITKQVDRLISSAGRVGTTPLYALFNHRAALPRAGLTLRPCGRGASLEQLGCTVVQASVVRSALRHGRWGWKRMMRFHGVRGPALPLRCTVCSCPHAASAERQWVDDAPCLEGLPQRVLDLLREGHAIGDDARDGFKGELRREIARPRSVSENDDRPGFLIVVPYSRDQAAAT